MTKKELIANVAKATGSSKEVVAGVVNASIAEVVKCVKMGESLQLLGFGTFGRKHKNAKVARNPQTGAEMNIPAKEMPFFKPSKTFVDDVNN